MVLELTKQDLIDADRRKDNPLAKCDHCGKETYDAFGLGEQQRGFAKLPEGFCAGNARRMINYHGHLMTLCNNCRYDVYGAY
jgi:hypothetical protein